MFRRWSDYTFLLLFLVYLMMAGGALVYFSKADLHLFLCSHHSPAADTFFRYYTQVGEWVPYLVCVGLLFYRLGWSAFVLTGTILSGLTTQILKHIVNAPRPFTWFAANYPDVTLPLVDGVHMSRFYSFPSGHTTSFFALFFALSIMLMTDTLATDSTTRMRKKDELNSLAQLVFFSLALLGGYSRIYLSQHFAFDVFAGSLVGMIITFLLALLLPRLQQMRWWYLTVPNLRNGSSEPPQAS